MKKDNKFKKMFTNTGYLPDINQKCLKIFPYLIIFLTVLILFIANYLPGTWLSGWDNLHPEFNFKLNLQREIFAGWQEYQGLGAVGGLMIAADIPRLLFCG